jgi:hypothetical protein
MAGLGSGDGPLSVRVRPSSIKRDCGRRTTTADGKCLINAHTKSRLTLEPLRTLRSEAKGQAEACPDRTRAIPCRVQVGTLGEADQERWWPRHHTISAQLARLALTFRTRRRQLASYKCKVTVSSAIDNIRVEIQGRRVVGFKNFHQNHIED